MSKTLIVNELRGLSHEQLNAKVVELKEELFGLRFAAAMGQLELHEWPHGIRRGIIRVYTALRERDLGIVDEPVIQEK